MSKVTIELSEYEELLEATAWALALEEAGVDSWIGYEIAQEIYDENNKVSVKPHLTVVK